MKLKYHLSLPLFVNGYTQSKIAAVITASVIFSFAAHGQSTHQSSNVAPALFAADIATSAITFSNGESLKIHGNSKGSFPLAAALPGETLAIQVRFANSGNAPLVIQALDGGAISIRPGSSLAADGTSSFQFQAPSEPGLCRINLKAGIVSAILSFWVADPASQSGNPAAITP